MFFLLNQHGNFFALMMSKAQVYNVKLHSLSFKLNVN